MATSEFGYLRKDDDGHWYLVPDGAVKEFDQAMRRVDDARTWRTRDEAISDFITSFDQYRYSGSIGILKVIIE